MITPKSRSLVARMAGNIAGHLHGKRGIHDDDLVAKKAVSLAEAILKEIDSRMQHPSLGSSVGDVGG